MHGSMFHEGERAVQRRAGVEDLARRIGSSALREEVPPDFAAFLSEQRLLVVASRDLRQRVWASPLIGPPGFARVIGMTLGSRTFRRLTWAPWSWSTTR